MPQDWQEPPGCEAQIQANAQAVLASIAAEADRRLVPTVAMAQGWHRDLYRDIPRPFDYYAGEVRDSDSRFPDLIGYEVRVGASPGVPSSQVPDQLARFEGAARATVERLDRAITLGTPVHTIGATELFAVLTLAANLHGDWVRIHPFANGNGRTARLWANWAALRYGLPPFVRLKPRPAGLAYAAAGAAAMRGDYNVMIPVFSEMLTDALNQIP